MQIIGRGRWYGVGGALLLATGAVAAQAAPLQELPLWPKGSAVLQAGIQQISQDRYAQQHPADVITEPSLYFYPTTQAQAAPAVLVFAGGGYKTVAIGRDSTLGYQGADVCHWLNQTGMHCIVVRYRAPNTGCNWNDETKRHESPAIPLALQDAQRAIALVRANAERWHVDPNRVGVMGFSAGGNLAVLTSTAFAIPAYKPVDVADSQSIRPDFAVLVYPGHMTMEHKNKQPAEVAARQLNSDIVISAQIPPTLLVHANDDPIDPVYYSTLYKQQLDRVGVPARLLLYATGGHAFGVKRQGKASDRWPQDAQVWFKDMQLLP